MWSDWPGNEGDTGINLVARHRDGFGYTAIQCKCYAPSTSLLLPENQDPAEYTARLDEFEASLNQRGSD